MELNQDLPESQAPKPERNSIDLLALQSEVEGIARGHGLDFSTVVYEPITVRELNIIAAKDGFPVRYQHWRFALEFDRLSKGYQYQGSKIYELVINTEPVYAYLLNTNTAMEQKLVMAHVCGHADFFKNNMFFATTNRKMLDQMGNHAARIKGYMDLHGVEEVEKWIDTCRSVENLIAPFKLPVRSNAEIKLEQSAVRFPRSPERDVIRFLVEHANLDDWRKDVLSIIREESYYFLPQAQTKIMNEGWAAYWHSKMMSGEMLLPREVVDYCDCNSSVIHQQEGQLNPYRLGLLLFKDIEERANAIGEDGREKIFEIRRTHNDVTFIDHYFIRDFAEKHGYIGYDENQKLEVQREGAFRKLKEELLQNLSNRGQPRLSVVNGNFQGNGGLLLTHDSDGRELDFAKARATLQNLHKIWNKPVHLETMRDKKRIRLSCFGTFCNEYDLS